MLLKITHQTDLRYSDFISESIMELRMVPRQEQDQHRLSFDLAIGPPTTVSSSFDWLGNTVHSFSVNMFHRQISIYSSRKGKLHKRARRHIDQIFGRTVQGKNTPPPNCNYFTSAWP